MAVTLRRMQSALLSMLADPATHAGNAVAVHETHASWVFVAGERAYKVKKPLSLGFLDYSTLELRHRACLEEVRVNQELAPGIYLGVCAIVKTATGFALTADDQETEAVEYAVVMSSFDQAHTLTGLIAAETLAPEHLTAVAARLSRFHRDAPLVSGGGVAQVLAQWRKNLRELRAADRVLELPIELAEGFGAAFARVHGQKIERRRLTGWVRDGHGDLRCEHVLATPSVKIVDRIEFDASLRHGDIASDLAFLTMDLEFRGQSWAAEQLLQAYRESGIDPGSEALLSFYGAERALVRAKVALIAAAEHEDLSRAESLAEALSLWKLAERLCWRARAPLAIVVCGPPGSGKSTLAGELARRSGFAVRSSDAVRKSAAGLQPTERASPEHYTHRFTHHTYELLAGEAREVIAGGAGVIVDATCGSRVERSTLLGRLRATGAPRLVVRCEIPLEVAQRRAQERLQDPNRVSDANPEIVAEQYRSFQPLEELAPGDVLTMDTRVGLDLQIARVTRAVDQ